MPHYLIRYRQTGTPQEREAHRAQHIAYRKGLGADLTLAGPLLDEDDQPVGSVIILSAATRAQAESIARGDPFVIAGLLSLDTIEPMRIAALLSPGL
jgi:uncharacterized protein